MSAEGTKMPEPIRAFAELANSEGRDIAYTYDTERSRWVFLNPMTADLWRFWQEATRLAMERAIAACEFEKVEAEETKHPSDYAYNKALDHAKDGIRRALSDVAAQEVGK